MSQRNREHLRLVGRMSDMLRVDEDLPTMLGAMPASCRVLALHLSPDQRHLYAACLNGPAKAPAADKQPPATKKVSPLCSPPAALTFSVLVGYRARGGSPLQTSMRRERHLRRRVEMTPACHLYGVVYIAGCASPRGLAL